MSNCEDFREIEENVYFYAVDDSCGGMALAEHWKLTLKETEMRK